MLIDALRRLSSAGFPIPEYQYTGMGSIHFYDFSLLHRYAGIERMLSVEKSTAIRRRVKFNCPYALITVRIASIGSVIRTLPRDLYHLLWLDYDNSLRSSYLADIADAVTHCRSGSIILATIDVDKPKGTWTFKDVKDYFMVEFGDLVPSGLKLVAFAPRNLPALNLQLIWRAIERGLSGRQGIDFQLLFNFVYKDGHQMLTVGGMIVDKTVSSQLKKSSLFSTSYARKRRSQPPYVIRVPVITRKERLYLDAAMPCEDSWEPEEFEIGKKDLKAYRDIYRFAPQYAELIL
jgi:hypothetical protein